MLDKGRRERVTYPSAKWFRRLESAYLPTSASWLSSTPNLSGRVQPDRLQYVFRRHEEDLRMPVGMYSVLALLPESSDFTLDAAVSHFDDMRYPRFKLRAELANRPGSQEATGFRVFYEGWSIVAWLEADSDVLSESREMSDESDLPAPAEVIARCSRRLSVWSDEDSDLEFAHHFEEFIADLRDRFGAFIKDYVAGEWRT